MAAKKTRAPSNIDARLTALRGDFEALQNDMRGLAGDVGDVASVRAATAMRSAEDVAERAFALAEEAAAQAKGKAHEVADDVGAWTTENADSLREAVREQPMTSILLALGAGAFLGVLLLRR
jgi:ElaB/YqjD/DUF883 family membrane-anchored ribosome-binding protein